MKSSPSIWHYIVSVKSTVKISSIFAAFLENMNFKNAIIWDSPITGQKSTRTYAELQDNVSKVHIFLEGHKIFCEISTLLWIGTT